MKSIFRCAALLVISLGLFSCEKGASEDNANSQTEDPVIISVDPVNKLLDAEEQGARLERTALAFIDKVNADDFSKSVELIDNLENTDWDGSLAACPVSARNPDQR